MRLDVFEIKLASFFFSRDDFTWGFGILDIDNFGEIDRSLFYIGQRGGGWILELFWIRVTPRRET